MMELLLGLPHGNMDPCRKKCGEKFPYMGLKSTSRNLREKINPGNHRSLRNSLPIDLDILEVVAQLEGL